MNIHWINLAAHPPPRTGALAHRLAQALLVLVVIAGIVTASVSAAVAAEPAEAPREWVDTAVDSPGNVISLGAGDDLQAALEQAAPGDTIELEPGAVFEGPFVLPYKEPPADPAYQWITIRSAGSQSTLPAGDRVSPADASAMARLETASGAVVSTAPGAHHYRFVGIDFRPSAGAAENATGGFLNALIVLDADEVAGEALPHHLLIERCLLLGDPEAGTRRGIIMNSATTAVIDSWLADFKMIGGDSQAIIGWDGPGPYSIRNNYLEAAGENLMFGGADSAIAGRVPSDIEVSGNHFARPLAWKADSPDYAGTSWTIKNLFELKNARRVLVEGNLFEYNWPESQTGFAILFTVRNQDGTAPWSVVQDVIFSNNIVRHIANGINILGHDDIHPSQQVRRIDIRNNLFVDLGGSWGGGHLIQVLDGTTDVVIAHNTAIHTGNILVGEGRPHRGFEFHDNIVMHNQYGIVGTDSAPGQPALERYFTGAMVRDNVIAGGSAGNYPSGNVFPPSLDSVGFVDVAGGDFRLRADSPYRAEGHAPGVDFAELCVALSITERPPLCADFDTSTATKTNYNTSAGTSTDTSTDTGTDTGTGTDPDPGTGNGTDNGTDTDIGTGLTEPEPVERPVRPRRNGRDTP